MKCYRINLKILLVLGLLFLNGCTQVTVDQIQERHADIDLTRDKIAIIGRHHSSEYETEPSLVSCIGNRMSAKLKGLQVISEQDFIDQMYPWFEPRYAPLNLKAFETMKANKQVNNAFAKANIKYVVWVEGSTDTTDKGGGLSCSISPTGAGCFGLTTWQNQSHYELTVWNLTTEESVGKVSVDAQGRSFMPAVIIPIPILAQVQNNACQQLVDQLWQFFSSTAPLIDQ